MNRSPIEDFNRASFVYSGTAIDRICSVSVPTRQWVAGGALVTALGVLVKLVGWTRLLAGYSESASPVPDDVVRNVAGNTLLRIGVTLLGVGVLAAVATLPPISTSSSRPRSWWPSRDSSIG